VGELPRLSGFPAGLQRADRENQPRRREPWSL